MLLVFKILLMMILFVSVIAMIDFEKKVDSSQAQRATALALASIAALVVLFIWG